MRFLNTLYCDVFPMVREQIYLRRTTGCSVPGHEGSLGSQSLLGLHERLGEDVTVVAHLGFEIVDEVGLREVVLVVRVRHGLESEGHGGAGLDVANLVHAARRVGVSVEELGDVRLVLREVRVAVALIPLLVEVDHVVSVGREELGQLSVAEDGIEDGDLIDGRLSTLVSDSRGGERREESEVDLPDGGLRDHEEAEGGIADEAAGPAVVRSVKARPDLVDVVRGSHLDFPVVVLENVVAIVELARVSLSLAGLEAAGAAEGGLIVDIATIERLGGLKSLVVPARVAGHSTAGRAGGRLGLLGREGSGASTNEHTLSVLYSRSISHAVSSQLSVVALTMVLLRAELSIIFV